ncbi:MAG: DNA helicase RecQ [Candidatus Cloacimonadales bacterium]|nr:DNA helicase RecQ [Candidatus Cloacimonadales bacterium]
MSENQLKSILKNTFGFDEFRLLQQDIIQNILSKKDTLIIMPTGSGKSLCYQLPALIFEGLTIVISPLISLMKDQIEQLHEMGIKAVFLNSSLSYREYQININLILKNGVKLVYLAPEAMLTQKILTILSKVKVDCITIDEAHCISEWGHDFRPEYRQLIEVRKLFPKAVCVALTATATPRVQQDIKDNLEFEKSNEFISSFNRENLFLQIIPKTEPVSQTLNFLEKFPDQSGIIYCFSRRQVDDLYQILEEKGFSVKPYHAGLTDEDRKQNQELFIKDDIQIIVATIAFGMGINKPNIRFVVHFDLPKNLEGYYQEIGRAGRDGLKSHCLLLFGYGDISKIKYFINQKEDKEKRIANIHLEALVSFCETNICRRIPLLNYFGEKYTIENCGICDNCGNETPDLVDITIQAQKFLSCMKRTGEYFGAGHIIDVLRGSKAQKVLDRNHHLLTTYNIGNDLSKKQWFHLSRQFIQQNLIFKDTEYGSLKITEKGQEVLQNKRSVSGLLIEEQVKFKKIKEVDYEFDRPLFEKLCKKRKELANASNLPPYIIFPDKALIEMAAFFPQAENGFMRISGVGQMKFEKYGETFLDIIRDYCQEFGIGEKIKENRVQYKPKLESSNQKKSDPKPKYILVSEAYNSGKSFEEIKAEFDVKQYSLLNFFTKYLQEDNSLTHPENFLTFSALPENERTIVYKCFDELGTEFLPPIYEKLNRTVSYNELAVLLIFYLSTKNLKENKSYSVENIRADYPQAYEKWTELDDELLKESYLIDKNISELAKLFQRKPGAIRSRLKKIGLIK